MNKLTSILVDWLIKRAEKQGRVFHIMDRKTTNPEVYLVRYIVFKCRYFGIYVHKFLKNDYAELHSHPWAFVTWLVKGGYKEDVLKNVDGRLLPVTQYNKPGSILYRKAEHTHRVQLEKELTLDQLDEAVTTLVIVGPKQKEWGFYVPSYNIDRVTNGYYFVHWREYLGIPEGEASKEQAVLKDMDLDM